MQITCILVRTNADSTQKGSVAAQLALQLVPDRITTMNEKGPYSTLRYGSTQTPKMPRIAPNWQIWMFGPSDDGMIAPKGSLSANLYYTSSQTCLVAKTNERIAL
jgi:hypothetical protein